MAVKMLDGSILGGQYNHSGIPEFRKSNYNMMPVHMAIYYDIINLTSQHPSVIMEEDWEAYPHSMSSRRGFTFMFETSPKEFPIIKEELEYECRRRGMCVGISDTGHRLTERRDVCGFLAWLYTEHKERNGLDYTTMKLTI